MTLHIVELLGITNGSGALTVDGTAADRFSGYIEKVEAIYVDGDTGADITVTVQGPMSQPVLTATNIGTASVVYYPRTLANKVGDGTAFTDVAEKILVTGIPRLVVAQGGASRTFRVLVYARLI